MPPGGARRRGGAALRRALGVPGRPAGSRAAPATREDATKAIVQDRYGSADVLRVEELATPVPAEGEVRVRVRAAGVDRGVWHLVTGLPYPVRLAMGLRRPKRRVPGTELAGTVDAVGAGVTRFRPGDEVFGGASGAFAEYACAREAKLAPKPTRLSFEEAAAIPIPGCTALQALRDVGRLEAGQKVLVIGAAGGVGTFAVQIAKALGAHVTALCRTDAVELVRSLGADEVVDYARRELPEGARWDLVVDTAGGRPLSRLRRALAPRGTLVMVGAETANRWFGGLERLPGALALRPFVRQRLRPMLAALRAEDLEALRMLVDAGKVRPLVERTYSLGDAAEALRRLERGHARGTIVLAV